MATNRYTVFSEGEVYHIFNRGVERRRIFTSSSEYQRFTNLLAYYRFDPVPTRFSQLHLQPATVQNALLHQLEKSREYGVSVLAYCLMPNHFHCIVRQEKPRGITRFVANISNGYTKYFNTKHDRVGPLLQGTFKAVHVETTEQLIHLSRYVHINPVVSFVISQEQLDLYEWSSLSQYVGKKQGICDTQWVKEWMKTSEGYRKFVYDQIAYAKELEKIKHLCLEK